MIISDLNYLESAEANIVGGYYFGSSSNTNVNANITENLNINKNFNSTTVIKGNFAGAEAGAFATGKNTSTQAISATDVVQGVSSASQATSISGTSGFTRRYW